MLAAALGLTALSVRAQDQRGEEGFLVAMGLLERGMHDEVCSTFVG